MGRTGRYLLLLHRRVILRGVGFWQHRWGERSLLAALAILIGAVAAFMAAALHLLVTQCEKFGIWLTQTPKELHESAWLAVLLVLPMIGLFISFLIQRYLGGPRYAKSLSPLILALSRRRTGIPFVETFNHLLSSGFSVGFGGSAGLEAPSVLTGAAIGANCAGFLNIDRRRRGLLLGCGAAAAISAIFDSPIAGVLFAAEVLLPEFSVSALVPMMMSSAVATVVSHLIVQDNKFFHAITDTWRSDAIPWYFICGIFCALIGVYVIRAAYYTAEKLKRCFRSPWKRLWAGGSLLCVLLLVFPLLRGQGYLYIEKLFNGDLDALASSSPLLSGIDSEPLLLVILFVAVILLKVIVSVLTVDSGGDGGIFAPSMFIGAFTGFAFARVVNLTGIIALQEFNFVAVGMCGVFTAVMRAPLTGIFLIAEVTGGYVLLVPLMIVSSVSYFVARFFEPNSIYRKALAESNLLDEDRDRAMLRRLTVRVNINRNYHALRPGDPMETVIELVERTHEEAFPVLDEDGRLLGVVYLERLRSVMLNADVHDALLVFDLMEPMAGSTLRPDDDLAHAMGKFDASGQDCLPVCDEQGKFQGFLFKGPIFAKYRRMVREADAF